MRDSFCELLGLRPDAPHLQQALTHPSRANESPEEPDNQRLEFLGDSVLGLCASELLYARFPKAEEGLLTRMRAHVVNAEALAEWARSHELQGELRMGRGADAAGLRDSVNVLADAVEALIAAVYFDAGFAAAQRLCAKVVDAGLEGLDAGDPVDPKSALQEAVQSRGSMAPIYEVLDQGGPAHEPWFLVGAKVAGEVLAEGKGRSKRLAERQAAAAALKTFSERPPATDQESTDA
jgi:ribonuclease-3